MLLAMHVTRNTPEQLIIADTPWLIGILLIIFIVMFVGPGMLVLSDGVWQGWIFVIAGGGMGFVAFGVFVRRVQIILDRASDTITIRRRSIFGFATIVHTLSNLSEAKLEMTTGSKGRTFYRPTLVLNQGMSTGVHPIVQAYSNSGSAARIVDSVNEWLSNTRLDSASPNA